MVFKRTQSAVQPTTLDSFQFPALGSPLLVLTSQRSLYHQISFSGLTWFCRLPSKHFIHRRLIPPHSRKTSRETLSKHHGNASVTPTAYGLSLIGYRQKDLEKNTCARHRDGQRGKTRNNLAWHSITTQVNAACTVGMAVAIECCLGFGDMEGNRTGAGWLAAGCCTSHAIVF